MNTGTSVALSIIIPTLNEAERIVLLLKSLTEQYTENVEVIVVDGGSTDDTVQQAEVVADQVLEVARGRAHQMNAGAAAARGEVLLFLHADTKPPPHAVQLIATGLAISGRCWGRFDVRISGQARMLPVVAWMMNWRSRSTGIATGDQAIFVHHAAFNQAGGYPEQPLMEDIELCRRLKCVSKPLCLKAKVTTSGRRWERRGVWNTILLMWSLRLRYWFGASAAVLARAYR